MEDKETNKIKDKKIQGRQKMEFKTANMKDIFEKSK